MKRIAIGTRVEILEPAFNAGSVGTVVGERFEQRMPSQITVKLDGRGAWLYPLELLRPVGNVTEGRHAEPRT